MDVSARFLHGLNSDISNFVEMFPYKTLHDILEQAKRTERKVQRSGHGRSSLNRTTTPWQRSQSSASHGGSQFQHTSTATRRPAASSASSPAPRNGDKYVTAAATAGTPTPIAISSTRSRDIECWKCKGRGHVSAECASKKILLINEQGEWEYESEHEGDETQVEHETKEGETSACDIQDNKGVALFPNACLVLMQLKKRKGSDIIFSTPVAPSRKVLQHYC